MILFLEISGCEEILQNEKRFKKTTTKTVLNKNLAEIRILTLIKIFEWNRDSVGDKTCQNGKLRFHPQIVTIWEGEVNF